MPSITEIIRGRRSVFPPVYNDRPIEKQLIEEILENANWAPNHRMTEPWRFRVFTGDSRQKLSDFLGDYYKKHTPAEKFSDLKYKKTVKKPLQSACIIAICMQRDPAESLPEWEEIAAVSCAVQNMWLTASAHGIGAYWSSPGAIKETTDLLNLKEGERCLGFFFMGYSDAPLPEGKRSEIGEKVEWM
ncbi:MAG: nitroreductase [Bacteroidota bacterium]